MQRRADPRLQSDRRLHALGAGQRRQLFGFGGGPAERPLGVDVLAGFHRGLGRLVVRRHLHHHGDRVDLRRGDHLPEVVERELRAERFARLFGALGPGGADRRQLDIRAGQQRREVRLGGPVRANVGANKSQANLVCHDACSSSGLSGIIPEIELPFQASPTPLSVRPASAAWVWKGGAAKIAALPIRATGRAPAASRGRPRASRRRSRRSGTG